MPARQDQHEPFDAQGDRRAPRRWCRSDAKVCPPVEDGLLQALAVPLRGQASPHVGRGPMPYRLSRAEREVLAAALRLLLESLEEPSGW